MANYDQEPDGRSQADAVRRQLADELVSVTERLREAEAQLDTARTIISQHVQRERDTAEELERALIIAAGPRDLPRAAQIHASLIRARRVLAAQS